MRHVFNTVIVVLILVGLSYLMVNHVAPIRDTRVEVSVKFVTPDKPDKYDQGFPHVITPAEAAYRPMRRFKLIDQYPDFKSRLAGGAQGRGGYHKE